MNILFGDIWKLVDITDGIVIPTNIGWRYRDGSNVMGRGLAKEAAKRWPELPGLYGTVCRTHKADLGIVAWEAPDDWPCRAVILFPTKPLDTSRPYMSWQNKASLQMIKRNAAEMETMASKWPLGRIMVPLVGCGNGGLDPLAIEPILHKLLVNPKFVLIKKGKAVAETLPALR